MVMFGAATTADLDRAVVDNEPDDPELKVITMAPIVLAVDPPKGCTKSTSTGLLICVRNADWTEGNR